MSNRQLEIGSNFMHRTLYDIASLQQGQHTLTGKEDRPLTFKIYRNTTLYPLHQTPPFTLGDARWSFLEFRQAHMPTPEREELDFETLSKLLYYTYGFSRHDKGSGSIWPFHRFVSSARCFFPAELYVWLPQTNHIPSGLYHYDNLHHSLALLRSETNRHTIAQALDTDLENCLAVLFISALFWKNAFHYLNFSYRLSTQEAGLVTSNVLLVAGTLGLYPHVHYQFLDQPLNQLLGFTPNEESTLAVIALYAQKKQNVRGLRTSTTRQSLSDTIVPIAPSYAKTSSFDHELCNLLTEIDQHSFLDNSTEIVTDTTASRGNCTTTDERIAPPTAQATEIDLAEALHLRSSGDIDFTPLAIPLPQKSFWEIVRYSLSAYHNDMQLAPASPRLLLYIVIQHVESINNGLYLFCDKCNMLHVIEYGDHSMKFQALQTQGNINSSAANMICYLVGDYSATSRIFGNRAYRILHLEAGLIAQRISVLSASQGLAARYSNSYNAAQCKMLLKLAASSLEPLAELVIGNEQPGAHADRRYRFSLLR